MYVDVSITENVILSDHIKQFLAIRHLVTYYCPQSEGWRDLFPLAPKAKKNSSSG